MKTDRQSEKKDNNLKYENDFFDNFKKKKKQRSAKLKKLLDLHFQKNKK